jgi:hypothetical protein
MPQKGEKTQGKLSMDVKKMKGTTPFNPSQGRDRGRLKGDD